MEQDFPSIFAVTFCETRGGGVGEKTRFILIWVHIYGGFLDRRSTN